MPSPAEFKPLAVLQKRRHISTEFVCSPLGRAQDQPESGLSAPGTSPLVAGEKKNPLLLPAKAQNDSSLLSVHFHASGAVVLPAQNLPGARCPPSDGANPSLAAAAPQNTSAAGTFPFLWETDTKQSSQSTFNPCKHLREKSFLQPAEQQASGGALTHHPSPFLQPLSQLQKKLPSGGRCQAS